MTVRTADIIDAVTKIERLGQSYEHESRVAFLRNFTIEGISPFLKYRLYEAGVKPEIIFGGYGSYHQEILDRSSELHAKKPDVISLALMLEELDPEFHALNWTADRALGSLEETFGTLERETSALVAVNTFLPPLYSEMGIAAAPGWTDKAYEVARLNQFIRSFVFSRAGRFVLVDWERIMLSLGAEKSIDQRFWYMSRAPFKSEFLDGVAAELTKAIKALKGKAKKCLVLDCDNTLWGGVLGEDGPEGIKLDRNEYPGRVYYEFQRSVLAHHGRGVVLALCSKNNSEDVFAVLDGHPNSLLRRSHIAASRINWEDKATNIRALSQELNLGLDSFVFVDDSPAECELVRAMLPEVTVIQVPPRLPELPSLLLKDGLFDTLASSAVDLERTRLYQVEAQRQTERQKFQSVDEYLSSLGMVATIQELRPESVPRVAQLTQKTNQFNLTTRRYSDAQIEEFRKDPCAAVFTLSAADKFGDMGLTGVMIARKDVREGMIDTLLLSCRVLGRQLETAFVRHVLAALELKWGVERWHAEYIPTKKNQQTESFWSSQGFEKSPADGPHMRYVTTSATRSRKSIPFITIKGTDSGKC
jgi:FkbH-like protein